MIINYNASVVLTGKLPTVQLANNNTNVSVHIVSVERRFDAPADRK